MVISTTASTNYLLCEKALPTGKDVYVDKTFVLSINETCKFVELADQSNRMLLIDHLLEYYPMVRKLKVVIDSKALGDIYHICSQILNLGTVQTKVNVLWNFAPHDITRVSETPRIEFDFGSPTRELDDFLF